MEYEVIGGNSSPKLSDLNNKAISILRLSLNFMS